MEYSGYVYCAWEEILNKLSRTKPKPLTFIRNLIFLDDKSSVSKSFGNRIFGIIIAFITISSNSSF